MDVKRTSGAWTDPLPGAASLVRGLLVLARAGQSGVLVVQTEDREARVAVRAGRVVGMRVTPDDGDSLGSALRALGEWDEAVATAASPPAAAELLGRWGVRVGATSEAALSHALRKQLQRRIVRLFALDPPELRLLPDASELGVAELSEPPTTAELIVGALRERASDEALLVARRRLGEGVLVLSSLGKELLEGAALWPDEQAMLPALERGEPVHAILASSDGSARAQRLLHALKIVGAVSAPAPREGYAVLLRKTRQLRRRAGASELLEVRSGLGNKEPRRAFRRLAREVHPDRFAGSAKGIQAASHEVMSALSRAQAELAR